MRLQLITLLLLAIGPTLLAQPATPRPADSRFKIDILATNLARPMELEIAPDGRIFFNEFEGLLRILDPKSGTITTAGKLDVFTEQENGFLGFALDPEFESTQWIYLFYSPTNHSGQRLSRFTMSANTLLMNSEKVMLEFAEQRRECCHHAGSVEFGPNKDLYISTGDNTHPFGDSGSYAPIDNRPNREPWDAQDGPSNTADLRGKILRITPTPDGAYSIPDGNLFPKDGSVGRPEIFVMGCRNPWRMSIDEKTGYVYWGDVGPDAGGDNDRGSRGYDEINQARVAGNYGWPYFIGPNAPYVARDFITGKLGAPFDPERPVNNSPRNTGAKVLPPAQPAFIYWPYGKSDKFPELGQGGRTACAGPVFHFKPEFKDSGGFPPFFDNCLLFYDWHRPFIKWARLDSDSNLTGIESFLNTVTLTTNGDQVKQAQKAGRFVIQRPIDSLFGPDGCLYLIDYGNGWGLNPDARMIRVSYQWGNLPPAAKAVASAKSGRDPLELQLDGSKSGDPDNDTITYEWRLHPGGHSLSKEQKPKVTLTTIGNFVIELIVTDAHGATNSTSIPVIVGNSIPSVSFKHPNDGQFFTPGTAIHYELSVSDNEEGSSDDYEELFDPKTFLAVEYGRAGQGGSSDPPGLKLMKGSDCLNCHSVDRKIVGPPFLEIANKYRGQDDALSVSVQRVLQGSAGVWSDVPMLPHATLQKEDVTKMVQWIFQLKPGSQQDGLLRGLSGRVTPPSKKGITRLTLTASFTDSGREAATALTGQSSITLRSRQIEAEETDHIQGAMILDHFVGAIHHGHSLRIDNLNLENSSSVTVRTASGGVGGNIELRENSPSGKRLAVIAIKSTGAWNKWTEQTQALEPSTGRNAIYVVFNNPGQSHMMNLDWLRFNP